MNVMIKNMILGAYVDWEGIVEAISHKTGARVEMTFEGKSGDKQSHLHGKCFDP